MREKDLRKMSRRELLQILLALRERNDELERQLKDAQLQLGNRTIILNESGSIAEAALQLNDVFSAAQAAAEQYLRSIEEMKRREAVVCQTILDKAREDAMVMMADAEAYSKKVCSEADAYRAQSQRICDISRK